MLRPLTGDFQVFNAFHSALFPTWKVRLPSGVPLGVPYEFAADLQNGLERSRSVGCAVPLAPGEDGASVERQRPPGIRSRPHLLPGVEVPPLVLEPDRACEVAGLTADGDGALTL